MNMGLNIVLHADFDWSWHQRKHRHAAPPLCVHIPGTRAQLQNMLLCSGRHGEQLTQAEVLALHQLMCPEGLL